MRCSTPGSAAAACSAAASAPAGRLRSASCRRAGAVLQQRAAILAQYKFHGAYPLPWWGIQASATYQNLPGAPISMTYVPTNAEIAPSLGRNRRPARGRSMQRGLYDDPAGRDDRRYPTPILLVAPNTVFEDRLSCSSTCGSRRFCGSDAHVFRACSTSTTSSMRPLC